MIVLGCGRSGTSLVAGLLASAGYFMGPRLHPPREANPTGFFEGEVVKDVNEALLDPLVEADGRTHRGSRRPTMPRPTLSGASSCVAPSHSRTLGSATHCPRGGGSSRRARHSSAYFGNQDAR